MTYSCAVCGCISNTPRCQAHTTQPRTRGHANQRMRAQALATHGPTCHICGQAIHHGDPWHLDHIIPLAHGGTDAPANTAPAHARCNLRKGST